MRESAIAASQALWAAVRRSTRALTKRRVVAVAAAVVLFLFLRLIVPHDLPPVVVESGSESTKTLVVVAHGLGGEASREQMLALAKRVYPGADLLAPLYTSKFQLNLSNLDAYELANAIEQTIHAAHTSNDYDEIILFGYSMGALILRKVFVWAHGEEQDRIGAKGQRTWTSKVKVFVSLAGMSRGWSIDPAPAKMSWIRYVFFLGGELFARFTGTGRLVLSMQRGAPFVADVRIQWLNLVDTLAKDTQSIPPVIHLLGDRDDIVSIHDSRDIAASPGVVFVTLADTDHRSIYEDLDTNPSDFETSPAATRRRAVENALKGDACALPADTPHQSADAMSLRRVERIVYIMHGIRDYAEWADEIEKEIQKKGDSRVAVVPAKYGWFPMLPFLLYYDRQQNVRWFMDTYTENRAAMSCRPQSRTHACPRISDQSPSAETSCPDEPRFDFVGHSNGTYILASALQHYKTLEVDRVYFAGSVVPKHYPWGPLIEDKRVGEVINVVATSDWVVAFFPRLFEQIAEWVGSKPVTGVLDIGSAGFRGFDAAADLHGKVCNIKFVRGGHGAGIDVGDDQKLAALVEFVAGKKGCSELKAAFDKYSERRPNGVIAFASNISWLVWTLLAFNIVIIGKGLRDTRIGITYSRLPRPEQRQRLFVAYIVVVVLLLLSV